MAEESTDVATRDWARISLIVGCVLAALVVALVVPSLGSDGIRGSPIDSVLPGEQFSGDNGDSGGGFGALNPGDSTGVGGETGFDKDTFGNNDTEVHFEVESSKKAYWRTGTYGTYTGTGWERNRQTQPYTGPIDYGGLSGEELVYEVEFNKPASTLPTAWRPVSVSGIDGLSVTDTGSIQTGGTVEPGTSFSGVSRKPERDTDLLRTAGDQYPDRIEQQYTQLPRDTPLRVEEFTEDLTAGDDNAYDTAVTIQDWLRSEKGYSLKANEQSEHIADTFIFEMEEGYCEYFATAMTTMLRSQGIPARYTVGYTTGQEVSENRYQVRGMNAHAWVEVYFPDVGWVRFDPTPGDSRLQTQQETLEEEEPDLDYNISEPGSPGEEFEPGVINDVNDDTPDDNDDTDEGGDEGYDISLNRTAVPGLPVEVAVTFDGEPVADVRVLINGESVGTTDSDGTLVTTVPAADELRIRIEPTGDLPPVTTEKMAAGGGAGTGGVGGEFGAYTGLPPSDIGPPDAPGSQEEPDNETVVDVETDASVSVSGDAYSGTNITVVATVEEVAIPNATVFVDGTRAGETDGDGRATIRLPDRAGNSTITVERGPVFGETDIRIKAVELDVSTGLVALPLTDATVEVTAGGEPLANAPVLVDGTTVGRTDSNGMRTVRLPFSDSATITTTQEGLSRDTTVAGLYRNLALTVVGIGLAIVIPAGVAYRRGYGLAELRASLAGLLGRVKRLPVWLFQRLDWLVGVLAARVSKSLIHLAELVSGKQTLSDLRTALGRWLRAKQAALAGLLPGRSAEQDEAGSRDGSDMPENVPTVREAWDRFLDVLEQDDAETKTPGELANAAMEADLPAEPVETLRDVFREVEYGGLSGSDRAEGVLDAIEAIETASADQQEGPAQSGGSGEGSDGTAEGETSSDETTDTSRITEDSKAPAGDPLRSEPPAGGDQ